MTVYTFTFIIMVSMYLAYLWGRKLTHGEIAAEVAEKTINKLEREGFVKLIFNEKTGQKAVSYTHLTLPTIELV